MVTSISAAGRADDQKIIREKMGLLGFEADKITKVQDGTYLVRVKGFKQQTSAVTLDGDFRSFSVDPEHWQPPCCPGRWRANLQ